MKTLAIAGFVIFLILSHTSTAAAHVLISDNTETNGGVLHITPDDDPVASETANIFFDYQGADVTYAELNITDTTGNQHRVNLAIDKSLLSGKFVFETKGLYKLNFYIDSLTESSEFEYTQRISRGATNGKDRVKNYFWAEVTLITSIVAMALLVALSLSRKTAIVKRSRFN